MMPAEAHAPPTLATTKDYHDHRRMRPEDTQRSRWPIRLPD